MEFSMKNIGTIQSDGQVTEYTTLKEQWNGCACVYPGVSSCECGEDCPCKRVAANRNQSIDAWDAPFI